MENSGRTFMYGNRRYMIIGMVIVLLLVFVARLFFLQIVSDDYKKWADSNAYQKRTLYPSRGMIYDRNGKLLVFNQLSYDVMVIMREVKSLDTVDFCNTVGITKEYFDDKMANIKDRSLNPGYSPYAAQLFMSRLSANVYGVLQEKLYKFPGFYIRNRPVREYGYHNAANVLGYVSEVNRKDIENDDYYVPSDYTGRAGVERSYETVLRGEKGAEILLRDNLGRIKGKYDDGQQDIAPVSGKNITLSIDMDLQALGEKLMQNKLGAIVMIEPATGEILSLVTSPSYDPALLTGGEFSENYRMLLREQHYPLMDRSIMGRYSPGSTFKPAQALAFLQEGVTTKDKVYSCYTGYPLLGGHPACHFHSSLTSLVYSLSTSCNAYYCWCLHDMLDDRSRYPTVQEALDAWRKYHVAMGYGYPLGVDLPGENGGSIPNSTVYDNNRNRRWNSSSIISIAIGQGEIVATPLQICNLAATIANRGYYKVPHVVREIEDMPLEEKYRTEKYTGINREYYDYVVEGMRDAVLGGTCTRLSVLWGLDICAKTGTVQNLHGRDHSACIAFAPMNNPKVAIAVFVENGETGARVAIPLAKLMLEKFFYGDVLEWDKWEEIRMTNWSTMPGSPNYMRRTIEVDEHADL